MFVYLSFYPLVKIILFSGVIIFLVLKTFLIDSFSIKEIFLYFLVILLISIISINTGDRQLMTLVALVLGARNVKFRYILFAFVVINILLLIFTYLSTL